MIATGAERPPGPPEPIRASEPPEPPATLETPADGPAAPPTAPIAPDRPVSPAPAPFKLRIAFAGDDTAPRPAPAPRRPIKSVVDDEPEPVKPVRTARKRATMPAPAPSMSFAVAALRARLDAELAQLDALGEPCEQAVIIFDAAKAAWQAAPRDLRPALKREMDRASGEVTRMGGKVIAIESRIKRTRAEIERAGAVDPVTATLPAGPDLLQRRADDLESELERLEELSAANAERTRTARREIAWAGDHATAAMRAELKAGEAEDARLVKRWLAASAERSRALRDATRAK